MIFSGTMIRFERPLLHTCLYPPRCLGVQGREQGPPENCSVSARGEANVEEMGSRLGTSDGHSCSRSGLRRVTRSFGGILAATGLTWHRITARPPMEFGPTTGRAAATQTPTQGKLGAKTDIGRLETRSAIAPTALRFITG